MKVLTFSCLAALLSAVLFLPAHAEETTKPVPRTIDLFDAIEEGLLDVKVVTESSMNARITAKNISDVPLVVNLPSTFAAVPLQQFGDDFGVGGGGGGGGRRNRGGGSSRNSGSGGSNNNSGNQSSGGSFGNNNSGSSNRGGNNWSLAPEKVVREDVKTVCLEHGKREPSRHMKYELKPLESVTSSPEVQMLCELVGSGAVDQDAAQAAVWHYNNGLSWEELANKTLRRPGAYTESYFSRRQMAYAVALGQKVEEKVAEMEKSAQKSTPKHERSASEM